MKQKIEISYDDNEISAVAAMVLIVEQIKYHPEQEQVAVGHRGVCLDITRERFKIKTKYKIRRI